MSYKNLNLDRARIPSLLAEAVPNGTVSTLLPKGKALECVIKKDGKEALLQFFYNNDGTTTIHYKVGKNFGLSEEVAVYISKNGLLDARANFSLAFKGRETDEVNLLMEYLKSEVGAKVEETAAPMYTMYKVQGVHSDTLVFKYFTNGTLQVQGKPLFLYREAISFLSEFLSLEEVIKSQSDVFKVAIDPESVRDELEGVLPTAYSFLGQTVPKILSASIALRRLDLNLEDYSAFVFPVLKGLEGYIKKLFGSKGIEITREDGFGGVFHKNATGSSFILRPDARSKINCNETCNAIQTCYSLFNKHRHGLFHADSIPDASRIISSRQEAVDLIDTVLAEIENTYGPIAAKAQRTGGA